MKSNNLLEAYSKRIALAESVYSKTHNGEALSDQRKLTTAVCLNNCNRFLTEAFANSTGTQMSAMGDYKKFCMTLTNLAVPDLIVYDIMAVYQMPSYTGSIVYLNIEAGSNKGQTEQGDLINNPYQYGTTNPNYTSSAVVENVAADATTITPAWTPVVGNKVIGIKADGSGEVELPLVDGSATVEAGVYSKVKYVYDNVYIPANDLPTLTAKLVPTALVAKARRIAIFFSQMAAFQAKQDYGFDLNEKLATQAVGELQREIDVEAVKLLADNAASDEDLIWSKTQPFGVNLKDHYESFANQIEEGARKIYDRTKKFVPNFMIVASDIRPVLTLVSGFKRASSIKVNGPYFYGELNGIKVFVSPDIEKGTYVLGVNNSIEEGTAAVFAPYMAVVPTQLLGTADGALSQGWSTMYDMKILNKLLLIKGAVVA